MVNAKGKGLVNTFWVTRGAEIVTMVNRRRPSCAQSDTERMSSSCASISATSNTSGSNGSIVDMSENSCSLLGVTILSKSTLQKSSPRSTDGKNCECIDWHVETMAAYLKRIVALRNCYEADQRVENPKDLIKRGELVLDELSEEIRLLPVSKLAQKVAIHGVGKSEEQICDEVISQLRDFVTMTEELYRDNPFHNFTHATHVAMSIHEMLLSIEKADNPSFSACKSHLRHDPLLRFSLLFSALIHDVGHFGVSNSELIDENPEIAAMYKRCSITEQHSVDIAWELFMDPRYKDLQQCIFANIEELRRFRQLVVNLVLSTDSFNFED